MESPSPDNYSVETGPAWVEMAQGPTQHGNPIYLYMTQNKPLSMLQCCPEVCTPGATFLMTHKMYCGQWHGKAGVTRQETAGGGRSPASGLGMVTC